MGRMRRTVGAQEETRVARSSCVEQSHTVCFALEYWQTIVVGTDAANEDGVAVVKQMVRCECGAHKLIGRHDVVGRVFGGDVLKHNFELRKITAQRNQLGVNESGLSVKQIDVAAGDFTVHQQQHADFLHGF